MIPWETITVQAITQDPQRCIYFMIDVSWPEDPPTNQNGGANGNGAGNLAENGSEDEGNDSEGSVHELTEFYVIPSSVEEVDEVYFKSRFIYLHQFISGRCDLLYYGKVSSSCSDGRQR